MLHDTHAENERIRTELGRLKLENQFLKTELTTADRAKALQAFETRSPSKMIAARVIATATGASASVVFVDRGSTSGVEKGMAVVTPDGIVGKVLAAYPTASQVLLVTDPEFRRRRDFAEEPRARHAQGPGPRRLPRGLRAERRES